MIFKRKHQRKSIPELKINHKNIKEKIKSLFSAIYLTSLSVILGVVFAVLVYNTQNLYKNHHQISPHLLFPLISGIMIINTWLSYAWFFFVFAWPPTFFDKVLPFLLGVSLIIPTFFFETPYYFLFFQGIFCFIGVLGFKNSYNHLYPERFSKNNHGRFGCCLLKHTFKEISMYLTAKAGIIFITSAIFLFIFSTFLSDSLLCLVSNIIILITITWIGVLNYMFIRGSINFWQLFLIHYGFGDEILLSISKKLKRFSEERIREFKKNKIECKNCELTKRFKRERNKRKKEILEKIKKRLP